MNKGKVFILEKPDGKIELQYEVNRQRRVRNNPDFPYKNIITCPHCGNFFKDSSSRGKLGKYDAYYHCSRGHKYYGVPKAKFEATIEAFMDNLRFTEDFVKYLEAGIMEKYKRRQQEVLDYSKQVNVRIG